LLARPLSSACTPCQQRETDLFIRYPFLCEDSEPCPSGGAAVFIPDPLATAMSLARAAILSRLRARHPGASRPLPDNPVRRFDWAAEERLSRFRNALEAVRGEVVLVGPDWPGLLFAWLREQGATNLRYAPATQLGQELERAWPDGETIRLIPHTEPVEACRQDLFAATDAGLTGCRGGIAETGSLVLWPSIQEPRLLSLVPPIHAVVLDAHRIRSTFHEFLVAEDWVGQGMPTNALLITGPSKSADIEQTLAYGVHGPKTLLVLVRHDQCPV
jgi:L-lactate dehydrogenase complex protein LldG